MIRLIFFSINLVLKIFLRTHTNWKVQVYCIFIVTSKCISQIVRTLWYIIIRISSLKGVYFGYIHVQNQTIGSIQFVNNTGTKCVCRFPNSSYTIQNVTYYGDRNIPTIQSFFDPGCRIVSNSGVQRPGYSCRVNITGVNNNFGELSWSVCKICSGLLF